MRDREKILELFEKNKEDIDYRVKTGIEMYRKGRALVEIKDKDGKPVKDAKVKLVQKNHEFRYGANIFMLEEFDTAEKNEAYKKYFKEAFNMATVPFYWNGTEPEKGKLRYDKNSEKIYRRPAPDLCVEFCKENGIEPREHALAYENFFPEWLRGESLETVKKEYERRCAEISERYGNDINTIEVTNETWWENGKTVLYEEPDFVEWCFKTARKYFKGNKLSINEWSGVWMEQGRARDKYYAQIERALAQGAEIDAIGFQYHMFYRMEKEYEETRLFYAPERLYKIMDNYARFGKPLQITEVTIPAYTQEPEDEQLQADIIKQLYSIWFSHKNVEQIIYWNLIDGYAAFAPLGDMTAGENYYRGGLLRYDFSPKPAYYAIKDLFEKQWRTNLEGTTDEAGAMTFRGFYGDYDVEVEANGRTVKAELNLTKNRMENKLVIEL